LLFLHAVLVSFDMNEFDLVRLNVFKGLDDFIVDVVIVCNGVLCCDIMVLMQSGDSVKDALSVTNYGYGGYAVQVCDREICTVV